MSDNAQCPGCGLKFNCVCTHLPTLTVAAHFALLTHENELSRDTNTGQWLLKVVASSSKHIWHRKQPCPALMDLLNDENYAAYLLFPGDESVSVTTAQQTSLAGGKQPLFIILDGTWQEAKKMLRKSAWLQSLPLVHITSQQESQYQLRRNQSAGHLCTLEVGAEVIRELGNEQDSTSLLTFFSHYMNVFQADKSGHLYAGESLNRSI